MSKLIKLSESQPTADYNYNQIQDHSQREAAKTICENYDSIYLSLKEQASSILKTNTVELSKAVYALKHSLDHGNFTSVCQGKYNLDKKKQSALVRVGEALQQGQLSDDAINMLSFTEPRAAQQWLKADEETKSSHVATFEQTGKAPSRRSFSQSSREYLDRKKSQEIHQHNYDRNMANAFADLPTSGFHQPQPEQALVNVTPVEAEVTTAVIADTDAPTSATTGVREVAMDAMHQWIKQRRQWTDADHKTMGQLQQMISNYFPQRY